MRNDEGMGICDQHCVVEIITNLVGLSFHCHLFRTWESDNCTISTRSLGHPYLGLLE